MILFELAIKGHYAYKYFNQLELNNYGKTSHILKLVLEEPIII
jgi:hypothetical protein